jgi:hypothetical protein
MVNLSHDNTLTATPTSVLLARRESLITTITSHTNRLDTMERNRQRGVGEVAYRLEVLECDRAAIERELDRRENVAVGRMIDQIFG